MEAFESINESASPSSVQVWSAEEENAQLNRCCDIKVMDIYDIKMKRCESSCSVVALPNIHFQSHHVRKYFSS
jgi:hypothetical protein